MTALNELLLYLVPWFIFFGCITLFFKLTSWVKGGKKTAIAFGFVLQAFLPNPNVERRIDVLAKQEQTDEDNNNENKD